MALKRKPPAGNVRRVAPIDNNLRYAITSKADETVQCESFLGKHALPASLATRKLCYTREREGKKKSFVHVRSGLFELNKAEARTSVVRAQERKELSIGKITIQRRVVRRGVRRIAFFFGSDDTSPLGNSTGGIPFSIDNAALLCAQLVIARLLIGPEESVHQDREEVVSHAMKKGRKMMALPNMQKKNLDHPDDIATYGRIKDVQSRAYASHNEVLKTREHITILQLLRGLATRP